MKEIKLTEAEQRILDDLYGLPKKCSCKKPTHIWIIEWLSSNDRHTGRELHDWMQERNYSFRSVYCECFSKDKVLAAIERAATHAEHHGTIPLIHLEAHGSENGLSDSSEGENVLTWAELTKPLQRLNIATRCNLIVLFSACKGYTGFISVFDVFKEKNVETTKIPALVTAGPLGDSQPKELFDSMKEFYRRMSENQADFDNAIESASNECNCKIKHELATAFVYDSLLDFLIHSLREDQKKIRFYSVREKFLKRENKKILSVEQKETLEKINDPYYQTEFLQKEWDRMFMIDIFPENKKRFEVGLTNVTKKILDIQKRTTEQPIDSNQAIS